MGWSVKQLETAVVANNNATCILFWHTETIASVSETGTLEVFMCFKRQYCIEKENKQLLNVKMDFVNRVTAREAH